MTEAMKIDNVELSKVRPSKTNPRKDFKEAEMADLTESVRFKGILQPLLVRPSWCIGLDQDAIDKKVGESLADNGHAPAPDFYEIVAGERRYRAADRASLATLPLIVRALSDQETLEIQLIENLQREDLDPFDEAEGYSRLLALRDGHGLPIHTVETIHARVGKPRRRIYYRLRLQLVPKSVRQAVREGNLPIDTAELIGSIPAKELREAAAEQILHPEREEGPLNRRKARELIADNYMRSLAGAPFDQNNELLVPIIIDDSTGERIGGGACTDCPMRTGNMEAIIGKTKRPDVCTNPRCFMMKCDAQFARLQTEAVKEGKKLVSEAEAKEIFDEDGSLFFDSPFMKLADKPDPNECPAAEVGAKLPTWSKLLEGLESKPSIYIARDPRGRIVELVDRKLAIEAVKFGAKQRGEVTIFDEGKPRTGSTQSSGAATPGKEPAWKKEEKKKREAAKFDLQVTLASLQELYDSINLHASPFAGSYADALIGLSILHAGHDGQWLICRWLKLEPKADKHNSNAKDLAGAIERYAEELSDKDKPGLITCLLLSQRLKFNGVKDEQFKRFAKLFGIDTGEIEKQIRKERDIPSDSKKKNLSGGAHAELTGGNSTVKSDRPPALTGRPTLPAQKTQEHKFEKITDNKYRCKNCGAFAVKHEGKLLVAKEFRGKPCVEVPKAKKPKAVKKKAQPRKKAKAKRR